MFVFTLFVALISTCYCKIEISDRARNFSTELLYFTAEEMQWHTVISTLGVWNLLSAVSMGAVGSTKKELRIGLFLPTKKNNFLSEYKTFMDNVIMPVKEDVALRTKNYIFVNKGLAVTTEFKNTLQNNFGVYLGQLPFNSPQTAADNANLVIRSSGVIEYDVFKPDDFDGAKMILTNLISFKGDWQSPFNASETHLEPFHDEDDNVIGRVNMMQQEGGFQFNNFAQINASVLRMPYGEDESYSFLVVLPYNRIKLRSVYSALEKFSIKEILKKLNRTAQKFGLATIDVKLPRFKISANVILNKPLQSMGIVNIFDPESSSFTKISNSADLYVSAIVHKAEIRVTEIGTSASASTSAYFENRALPTKFNANRPFLYFIVKDSTATNIFSGAYSKPTLF